MTPSLSLTKILFLSEGLLKLPPVLLATLKTQLQTKTAASWYAEVKKYIEDSKPLVAAANNWLENYNKHKSLIHSKIEGVVDQNKREGYSPDNFDAFFIQHIFWADDKDTGHIGRFGFEVTQPTAKSIQVRISFGGSKTFPGAQIESLEYESYGDDFTDIDYFFDQEVRGWMEKISRMADDFKSMFESGYDKPEPLEQLSGLTNQPAIIDAERAINSNNNWGFNLTARLTPEQFTGWEPGGKPFSKEDLEKLRHVDPWETAYPDLYIQCKFKKTQGQQFVTNVGEHYLGFYSSPRGKIYGIELVVPTFNLAVENHDINEMAFVGEKFERDMRKVFYTLEHELGHFVQDILQKIKTGLTTNQSFITNQAKDQTYEYGVNSKKLSKPKDRLTSSEDTDGKLTAHGGRDVEFYTNLGDSYNEIKHQLLGFQNEYAKNRLSWFKRMIGWDQENRYKYVLDHDMEWLKQNNRPKWIKAIKVLYVQLQKDNIL